MKHTVVLLIMLFATVTVQAQQRHSDTPDDILQYIPYAAVFGMKAAGVDSRSDWTKLAVTAVASWGSAAAAGWILKHTVKEWRPDDSDQKSFPSGHSLVAFSGATVLHKEFGHLSPWISVAGYGLATLTAIDRVARDRHHWYDVAAGAGIGFLATECCYFISDKIFKSKKMNVAFTGNRLDVAIRW